MTWRRISSRRDICSLSFLSTLDSYSACGGETKARQLQRKKNKDANAREAKRELKESSFFFGFRLFSSATYELVHIVLSELRHRRSASLRPRLLSLSLSLSPRARVSALFDTHRRFLSLFSMKRFVLASTVFFCIVNSVRDNSFLPNERLPPNKQIPNKHQLQRHEVERAEGWIARAAVGHGRKGTPQGWVRRGSGTTSGLH